MINEITGKPFAFFEKVLNVADSQRAEVEVQIKKSGCTGNWSRGTSQVETHNDLAHGNGVSVWTLSFAKIEDAKKVQSALDAIN